jgi:NADH:ubiquinone oxidoreductase subunit F (NADH-binding)
MTTTAAPARTHARTGAAATPLLPRLLTGAPASGALTLRGHLDVHGPLPQELDANAFIETVREAGLRGRGGAAFPTARKLRAVRDARGRALVVANCSEGEPASAKDRMLIGSLPHLVLDGAVTAARVTGARRAVIALPRGLQTAQAVVERAIAERDDPIRLELALIEDSYVSGQESALISQLNGGEALPTMTKSPQTLVQNAETLAHLALIARHGAAWFRHIGTFDEPGSALVTVLGAVRFPGVYEVATDVTLTSLLRSAGGQTEAARAVLIGGYAGTWIDGASVAGLSLGARQLRAHGASRGAGTIAVLGHSGCGPAETARVMRYMAGQSAGQCGPCVHGLAALAEMVGLIVAGQAPPDAAERLGRWLVHVPGRGACRLPDGAVRFLSSALKVFGSEFGAHFRGGHCARCAAQPLLAVA